MSGPDQDDQDEASVQRVASASDGSPLHTAAASSVFNWRGAGTAAATAHESLALDDADEVQGSPVSIDHPHQPEEEKPMATKKKRAARARTTTNGSPQLQICSALLQFGAMTREALGAWGEEVGLTAAQISSALNNAKSLGRLAKGDDGYELTQDGQAWLAASGVEPAPKKPTRRAARKTAHRRSRAKRKEVDTSPTEEAEIVEPTFRCAVLSDGCFFITKDGVTIELEPEEHKKMLHYLERMAEPESA